MSANGRVTAQALAAAVVEVETKWSRLCRVQNDRDRIQRPCEILDHFVSYADDFCQSCLHWLQDAELVRTVTGL